MAEDTPSLQDKVKRFATLPKNERIASLLKLRDEDRTTFDRTVLLPAEDFIALGAAMNYASTDSNEPSKEE